MKKILFLITLLTTFVNNSGQNVTNEGFENWTGSTPDGWSLDTQGTDCSFSQVSGESGFALRAAVTNNGSGVDGEFYQIVEGIVAGNSYDFQIRVKGTATVTNALRFWGVWLDSSSINLTSSNIQPTTYYNTTTEWSTYSIIGAVAPANAVKVKWSIRLYGIQTTDFDNVLTPLPVELTNFSAFATKSNVELSWSTATEVNNYGFEIERKVAEASGFEKIGFVPGHGNSNSPKDYSFTDNNAPNGNLQYRLKQIDFDGSVSYSDVVSVNNSLAKSFKLFAPYPNPFNPTTTIRYSIPTVIARSGATKQSNRSEIASTSSRNDGVFVTLKVYDIIGREVATLVNEKQYTGEYEVEFNAKNLPSGIYFSTLRSNGNVQTQKLILLK